MGWNSYRWNTIVEAPADESSQSTDVVVMPSYHYYEYVTIDLLANEETNKKPNLFPNIEYCHVIL